jgi:hypothetical protein
MMLPPHNILEGFDPLSTGEIEHSEINKIIQESQKRDILNILRSYTGTLDVFSEAIQNAIDAVEQKSLKEPGSAYEPRIWVTIDMRNNLLRFVDNGVGMTPEQVKFFLRPNVSFKELQNLRGHKGVGATFLAYGYSSFSVQTKQGDLAIAATLNGGRQWAESTTDHVPRPKFSAMSFETSELQHEHSGTCIEVVLGSHRDERPRLSWLNIADPEIWHKVLRLRSPLGGVYLKTGGIKPIYLITVISLQGLAKQYTSDDNGSEFYFPHDFAACSRIRTSMRLRRKSLNLVSPERILSINFQPIFVVWIVSGTSGAKIL